MKKEHFLDLVCEHLAGLGVDETEIVKQRAHINSYLGSLGIGEESEELDYESPEEFAEEIFGVIRSKQTKKIVTAKEITEAATEEISEAAVSPDQNVTTETPSEDHIGFFAPASDLSDEDDDVKLFTTGEIAASDEMPALDITVQPSNEVVGADDDGGKAPLTEADIDECENTAEIYYDELGDSLEAELSDYYDGEETIEEGATREFSVVDIAGDELEDFDCSESDEDDYYAEDDYSRPEGNPVFFWILTVILSPLWISLGALAFLLIGVGYVLLPIFLVIYIPLLIALILGGSVSALAELVYSIIKFVTGEVQIGLLELGLGFIIVALTLCLSVLIYRFGTKYASGAIKNYWKTVRKMIRKLKKGIRKIKGACSI